jgi:hypothetical protein
MAFETEPRMIQLLTRAQVTGRPLTFERSRANCATDPLSRISCAIDLCPERERARIVFANFFVIVAAMSSWRGATRPGNFAIDDRAAQLKTARHLSKR